MSIQRHWKANCVKRMICLEHLLSCPAQTGSNCLDAIVHGLPATACGAERARVYYCWLHGYFVNILNGKYIRAHRLQGRSRRVLRKKSTRPIRTLLTRPRQRIFQPSPPLLRSTAENHVQFDIPSVLHFKVSQNTWISVRQREDGQSVYSGLLSDGEERDIQAQPTVGVVVGNEAGLGSLELDGEPVEPSKYKGRQGSHVARFSLP